MKKFLNVSLYAIVLTLMVGFSSCSKDDDDTFTDPTSVLTTGKWQLSTDEETAFVPLSGDLDSQMKALRFYVEQFNIASYEFVADGKFKYSYFGLGTGEGTWALSSDKKILTTKNSDNEVIFTVEIIEAKSNSIKFKVTYTKAQLESTSDVSFQIALVPLAKG